MERTPKADIQSDDNAELHARRVEIGEGRYLIYFTFGDEPETSETEQENV